MKKKQNLNNPQKQALNIPDVGIRLMSFEEIFESRLQYFQEHYFEPIGWTGLWLLGESHFAIHTFPEEQKSYIELSSCNEDYYLYFVANCGL